MKLSLYYSHESKPRLVTMPIDIFAYRNPGAFLKARYAALKEAVPGISHRYISAELGFRSPAIFCQIITGRITPSSRAVDGLARIFGLDLRERDYLAHLLMLRRARDSHARSSFHPEFFSGGDASESMFSKC